MPSRRDQIRMSEEEQVQFIDEQKSLQVATINRDGTPHLSTLWFDVVDGDIVFETFTKSQKIKIRHEMGARRHVFFGFGLLYPIRGKNKRGSV